MPSTSATLLMYAYLTLAFVSYSGWLSSDGVLRNAGSGAAAELLMTRGHGDMQFQCLHRKMGYSQIYDV